ncbi:MAG: efflux RND transporter periplasmic adaptor subunit [Pseudomonadales bacterium]
MTKYPLLMSLLMLALLACTEEAPQQQAAATQLKVHVHTLQATTWQGRLQSFGVIEAAEEIPVSVDFQGIVSRVLVKEGQHISKGDLLIEMDAEKASLRVEQAEQMVSRAKAVMDEARLNLDRRHQLAEKETVSKEVLGNSRLALDSAVTEYREALATRQLAQRELKDTRVISPVNGAIDIKSVEGGETVMAGAQLLTIQATDVLAVKTWISEKDINFIRPGDSAVITLAGMTGRQYEGVVEWVGVNAHEDTGNFPAQLIIDPAGDPVRPGMTAKVNIQGFELPETLVLPEDALVDRNRRRVVFVVEEGRAVMREPLLGAGMVDSLFIYSGLVPGEKVIVGHLDHVIDGVNVSILNEDSVAQ